MAAAGAARPPPLATGEQAAAVPGAAQVRPVAPPQQHKPRSPAKPKSPKVAGGAQPAPAPAPAQAPAPGRLPEAAAAGQPVTTSGPAPVPAAVPVSTVAPTAARPTAPPAGPAPPASAPTAPASSASDTPASTSVTTATTTAASAAATATVTATATVAATVPAATTAPTPNSTAPAADNAAKKERPPPTAERKGGTQSTAETKEKAPLPKAMVKPHVLTHVIDGFIIQEASEPFTMGKHSSDKENHPVVTNESQGKRAADPAAVGAEGKAKVKRSKSQSSPSPGGPKKPGRKPSASDQPSSKKARLEDRESNPGPSDSESASESSSGLGQSPAAPVDKESVPINPNKPNPLTWKVEDVVDFIRNLPGCSDYAEDFALQEIDGQALMLLRADHLMQAMSIRLGPALKICAKIDSMRAAQAASSQPQP
ncbi:Polyhomeotic-like protein 2 [Amphibalanus amphitrite]|uniref:Polyhomeotic-like protein 2 n=1 Tax=Amphibalanus amphitrite TaxID=1232801 RepID=A0A6A4WLP7_AMPAM|nr:Polyhomeotic-like protein 2 [Amphibalanus amphitrite]